MTDQAERARWMLSAARTLLLDFDGPVCSVYAGIPSAVVADQLRAVLADGGHTDLPDTVDPFDLFEYAATLSAEDAHMVHAAFTAHEVEAIQGAEPTPGAHELIQGWHASGRALAIVSNNAAPAVHAYLDLYHLRPYVDTVAARTSDDPAQLKPNPVLLREALDALDVDPAAAVLIGDSTSDVQAAHRIGTPVIGYSNKPGKADRLTAAGAETTITSLAAVHAPDAV